MTTEYTADMWRNATYLKGETFTIWLRELSQKYNLSIRTISVLYRTTKKEYMKSKNIVSETNLYAPDYVQINNQVEQFLEKHYSRVTSSLKKHFPFQWR